MLWITCNIQAFLGNTDGFLLPWVFLFSKEKVKICTCFLFLCLVNFSNAQVIEIYVSCNLNVDPMNARL